MENNSIIRKFNNIEQFIKNRELIQSNQSIDVHGIKSVNLYLQPMENPNIGSIDTERFLSSGDVRKIYALGYITNDSDTPVVYYVDNTNNSDE